MYIYIHIYIYTYTHIFIYIYIYIYISLPTLSIKISLTTIFIRSNDINYFTYYSSVFLWQIICSLIIFLFSICHLQCLVLSPIVTCPYFYQSVFYLRTPYFRLFFSFYLIFHVNLAFEKFEFHLKWSSIFLNSSSLVIESLFSRFKGSNLRPFSKLSFSIASDHHTIFIHNFTFEIVFHKNFVNFPNPFHSDSGRMVTGPALLIHRTIFGRGAFS